MIAATDLVNVADGLTMTRGSLTKIANAHVEHFRVLAARARAGALGYRLDECEGYLATWQAAVKTLESDDPVALGEDARGEFIDALTSGDYDEYLADRDVDALLAWWHE